jgi:hypothetical protein
MFGSFRRLAAASGLAAALAVGVPASASAAVSMSIPDTAQLTAGILVTVPATVTCGPYELPPSTSTLSLTIRQAVKRQVATGSVFLGGFTGPGFSLICDGARHVYSVDVLPDRGSPPFRRGDAIANGGASTQSDFCCTQDVGSVGPQVIRLR